MGESSSVEPGAEAWAVGNSSAVREEEKACSPALKEVVGSSWAEPEEAAESFSVEPEEEPEEVVENSLVELGEAVKGAEWEESSLVVIGEEEAMENSLEAKEAVGSLGAIMVEVASSWEVELAAAAMEVEIRAVVDCS